MNDHEPRIIVNQNVCMAVAQHDTIHCVHYAVQSKFMTDSLFLSINTKQSRTNNMSHECMHSKITLKIMKNILPRKQ